MTEQQAVVEEEDVALQAGVYLAAAICRESKGDQQARLHLHKEALAFYKAAIKAFNQYHQAGGDSRQPELDALKAKKSACEADMICARVMPQILEAVS